ncbi:unnamed protein product [Lactuca saligna]|uniref:Uncharacterized protein n=1 Tax=Lactuca saligna TaxID=75948 RepID=A0AA35W0Z1_LACSI|nr:unnamed protein product [Lactuca saligna]
MRITPNSLRLCLIRIFPGSIRSFWLNGSEILFDLHKRRGLSRTFTRNYEHGPYYHLSYLLLTSPPARRRLPHRPETFDSHNSVTPNASCVLSDNGERIKGSEQ